MQLVYPNAWITIYFLVAMFALTLCVDVVFHRSFMITFLGNPPLYLSVRRCQNCHHQGSLMYLQVYMRLFELL